MAKTTKICRVCGKSYEACQTVQIVNTFRWQDVSCSPKCGAEYLRRVRASRGEITEPNIQDTEDTVSLDTSASNEDYYGFDGESDEDDEEYFSEFGSDIGKNE